MTILLALAAAVALSLPAAAGTVTEPDVVVTTTQTRLDVRIGESVTIDSRVTNRGATPADHLVAHVNVASVDGSYVDLEDWSAEVTKVVAPVPPGGSATVSWRLQAVNAGRFHVYVVVLPETGSSVASRAVAVTVAQRRTVNVGGVLPVALATPLLVGAWSVVTRRRLRRPGRMSGG